MRVGLLRAVVLISVNLNLLIVLSFLTLVVGIFLATPRSFLTVVSSLTLLFGIFPMDVLRRFLSERVLVFLTLGGFSMAALPIQSFPMAVGFMLFVRLLWARPMAFLIVRALM